MSASSCLVIVLSEFIFCHLVVFRDWSYLLYDINRQTAPVSKLNQFVKTSQIHNYRTRSVSSDSFYVKFSRTDKMYAFFTRIGAKFGTLFLIRLKYLNVRPLRKEVRQRVKNPILQKATSYRNWERWRCYSSNCEDCCGSDMTPLQRLGNVQFANVLSRFANVLGQFPNFFALAIA